MNIDEHHCQRFVIFPTIFFQFFASCFFHIASSLSKSSSTRDFTLTVSCIFQRSVRASERMRKQIDSIALDVLSSKFADVEGKETRLSRLDPQITLLRTCFRAFFIFLFFPFLSTSLFPCTTNPRGKISFAVVDSRLRRLYPPRGSKV